MSRLWLPPSWEKDDDAPVTARGRVIDARYYAEHETIVVKLKLRDGSKRFTCLRASCFSFNGKKYDEVPKEQVHAEMTKTASLFVESGRAGREINLRMFSHQARLRD